MSIKKCIILSIFTNVVTIAITYMLYISTVDQLLDDNDALFSEVSLANQEITTLTKKLDVYNVTTHQLESLGASHTQAVDTIRASQVYNLDPKLLGALIASESSFTERHHALPEVIGLGGINTGCGSILPYSPYTDFGNILNAAKLLRDYKNLYITDVKAIKRYKGYCKKGEIQAKRVITIKNNML